MEPLDNMNYLQTASKFCFVMAALAFLLAVILFFLFDIRNIFLIETGRAKSKAIQEMNERNQRTGKLRDDTGEVPDRHAEEGPPPSARNAAYGKTPSKGEGKPGKQGREGFAPPEKKERAGRHTGSRFGTTVEMDGTAVLDRSRNRDTKGFKIVQKTIVIHTNENISA